MLGNRRGQIKGNNPTRHRSLIWSAPSLTSADRTLAGHLQRGDIDRGGFCQAEGRQTNGLRATSARQRGSLRSSMVYRSLEAMLTFTVGTRPPPVLPSLRAAHAKGRQVHLHVVRSGRPQSGDGQHRSNVWYHKGEF